MWLRADFEINSGGWKGTATESSWSLVSRLSSTPFCKVTICCSVNFVSLSKSFKSKPLERGLSCLYLSLLSLYYVLASLNWFGSVFGYSSTCQLRRHRSTYVLIYFSIAVRLRTVFRYSLLCLTLLTIWLSADLWVLWFLVVLVYEPIIFLRVSRPETVLSGLNFDRVSGSDFFILRSKEWYYNEEWFRESSYFDFRSTSSPFTILLIAFDCFSRLSINFFWYMRPITYFLSYISDFLIW